jgi:SAM-dependent methyltransferase
MDRHSWDERYAAAELLWSAGPNRFVVDECSDLAPGRALDLACGEGRNAMWLAERGWHVTAVDFSNVALERGRKIAEQRGVDVQWEFADVTAYEPAAKQFDLVLVMYLQLPANERAVAFGRAAGAVAPGGTLLVVGHDVANVEHGHGGPRDASVCYSPSDVTACFDDLRVDKAVTVERPVDTDDGVRVALDALVRATR